MGNDQERTPDRRELAPGRPFLLVVLAVSLGLATAACGSGDSDGGGTQSAKVASNATDPCLIGQWRVIRSTFKMPLDGETVHLTGGAGALCTFAADGSALADYKNSAPYEGTVYGQKLMLQFHGISRSRGIAREGRLADTERDLSQLSISGTLGGDPLGDVSLEATPIAPSQGTYTCQGSTAELRTPEGTWELARA